MPDPSDAGVFHFRLIIPPDAIDGNGHVNNVAYVQWMQDAAIRHFEALGGTPLMAEAQATWVVRSHKIEYLSPAFAGEEIEVRTWIANARRVRSLRKYEFVRPADGKTLVKGETDWVFISTRDGRPAAIPPSILRIFPMVEQTAE
jgi:acyl-CoA thioester hydrolase